MKLRRILVALSLASSLIAEASLLLRSLNNAVPRIEPRLKRLKQPTKSKGGWPKYFHEPGVGQLQNHYDIRYEHGIVSYEDKQNTQIHMLRAYLEFFEKNRVETWLAHGTLLGWWWNGRMLPWDWDIDTQVSLPSLKYLGQHFNGSIYDYSSAESNPDQVPVVERQYLLDVNPAIVERDRGNGDNVIDARWIDMRNGLYIDITGLAETEPKFQPGIWSCKNYHHYHTTDLYPMRETLYEGMVAKIPYAYDRILTTEYQEKALVVTEYEGHKWQPEIKEWVKKTPAEIKQERLDRQAARRKKQEEKAARIKAAEDRKKAEENRKKAEEEEEAKTKEETIVTSAAEVQNATLPDDQIKEPPKEPIKLKRDSQPEQEPEPYWEDPDFGLGPELEDESSGLAHLRRPRQPIDMLANFPNMKPHYLHARHASSER